MYGEFISIAYLLNNIAHTFKSMKKIIMICLVMRRNIQQYQAAENSI